MSTKVTTEVKTAVPDLEQPGLHFLDDPDDVDHWLAARAPGAMAGVCRDGAHCPLASYLAERNGMQASVGQWEYMIVTDAGEMVEDRNTPGWAKRFVKAVDRSRSGRITVRVARRMLQEALALGRD